MPTLTDLVFLQPHMSANEWKELAEEHGGVICIDKPATWTSFDIVKKIRNMTQIRKVGHAGTLDPLATGLLIVCFYKKATKHIEQFQAGTKVYEAVIRLGATTKTLDAEAPEEHIVPVDISENDVNRVLPQFLGTIEQVPPLYSAVKQNGVRLYKLARKGQDTEIRPRLTEIHALENIQLNGNFLSLTVTCSKGTYIRSLARDIGEALGCGGYLHSLRRTHIGEFSVKNAMSIESLIEVFGDSRKRSE